MEHAAEPLWFTVLLNKILAVPVTAGLHALGFEIAHPEAPIPDHVAMQVVVLLILFTGAFVLRWRLSVTEPGRFQLSVEFVFEFIRSMVDGIMGSQGRRYVALIGTVGIFIAFSNLLGLIPSFHSPTVEYGVTLGCALVVFLYYHYHGVRHHGPVRYLKHFCGPTMALALLIFPIEIVGHLARVISLTIRLRANMFVGEKLEEVFGSLVPVLIPAVFMGLHIFVSLLQAYIFMILPSVYLSMATSDEH